MNLSFLRSLSGLLSTQLFFGFVIALANIPQAISADNTDLINAKVNSHEAKKRSDGLLQRRSEHELRALIAKLVSRNRSEIRQAIAELQQLADPLAIHALRLLKEKRIRKTTDGVVVIVNEDETIVRNYFSRKKINLSNLNINVDDLITPNVNSSIRLAADIAVYSIQLFSQHLKVRRRAARELAAKQQAQTDLEQTIKKALLQEKNAKVQAYLNLVLARIDLESEQENRKLQALKVFKAQQAFPAKSQLEDLLSKDDKGSFIIANANIRNLAQELLQQQATAERINAVVNWLLEGLSEGSILLLAAIGLAITFGLMGVINMAHGEMVMLGAFTTYTIQLIFQQFFPEAMLDYYLLVAIPCAFLVSGLVGIGIEKTVIKHLYNRPLDTLLASWGIGLLIIQAIDLTFGAQNVPIKVPDYLIGSFNLTSGISLSYVRLVIILFAALVVLSVWMIMRYSTLGLKLRAVTQNRDMASSMGIATKQVDMWAFGLGSGIAGLGGVALAQYTNVGPVMGQSFIIMCFLVVVIGGVGNLVGTVFGALTIGFVSKIVELWVGANLRDFVLLGFVILFIQFRPQGLFPPKGRVS